MSSDSLITANSQKFATTKAKASILFVYTPTAQRQAKYKQFRGEPRTPNLKKERIITKDNKNKLVALRFRESDYNKIKSKAEKAEMNFTEFVTTSALNKKIVKCIKFFCWIGNTYGKNKNNSSL